MDRKELGLLVVEDNILMQKMMIPMLERLGFQKFITASNGLDAWRKLNGDDPIHLILSDLVMPKLDGIGLLHKVRASERFWDLPFIMVTGEENQNQLMTSIEVEVDAYILKPFTPIKLEAEISRVLEQKYKPSPYHLALHRGRTLLAQDGAPAAILEAFEEASRFQPQEADPYYFCAIIHERLEHRAEAKASLERCIQLKEAYPKAYDLLALIYRREQNYAAERETLVRISAMSPHNVERNLNLGLACARVGDLEGVRKYLKVAARYAEPDDLSTYERIFKIYLEGRSMNAEAEVIFRRYIDKNLETPRLLNKFALFFKAVKDYERAIFLLERIVHIWRTVKNHGIPPEDMAIYYFNLAVAIIEQAGTMTEPEAKKAAYQAAAKLVDKAMECNIKHPEAQKLDRWLRDRLN
jgi:CheY-like chemotaxis protein